MGNGDGLQHAGVRPTHWHEIRVDEPMSKTKSRLKDRKAKPDLHAAPTPGRQSAGDMHVKLKHWLGRMSRNENAH